MKICPRCGKESDSKFCMECGYDLTGVVEKTDKVIKVCPKCGFETETKFCSNCGCDLTASEINYSEGGTEIIEEKNSSNITNSDIFVTNNKDAMLVATAILMFITAICCVIHSAQMLGALGALLDYVEFSDYSDFVGNITMSAIGEILVAIAFVATAIVIVLRKSSIPVKYILLAIPIGYAIKFCADITIGIELDSFICLATILIWLVYVLPLFGKLKSLININKGILITITAVLLIVCIISDVISEASVFYIITMTLQYLSLMTFGVVTIDFLRSYKRANLNTDLVINKQSESKINSYPLKARVNPKGRTKCDESLNTSDDISNNIQQLRQWKTLYDEGIITEEEFNYKKSQLL